MQRVSAYKGKIGGGSRIARPKTSGSRRRYGGEAPPAPSAGVRGMVPPGASSPPETSRLGEEGPKYPGSTPSPDAAPRPTPMGSVVGASTEEVLETSPLQTSASLSVDKLSDMQELSIGPSAASPEKMEEEHANLVSAILTEEETLVAAHREQIHEMMNLVKKEMSALDEVEAPGADIDTYVETLEQILSTKASVVAGLQKCLENFKQTLAAEEELSASIGSSQNNSPRVDVKSRKRVEKKPRVHAMGKIARGKQVRR